MPFELRITNAGRAALADGNNRGTQAIRLTKVAIGDGQGPGGAADDGRTALRSQRAAVAAGGSSTVAGRIAVRGEFNPAAAYGVTEVGLLGRVGSGAEELYAYWTDAGALIASTVSGTRLVIAASLDIAPAAAQVTVAVSAAVSLGDPALSGAVTALGGRVDTAEADIDALEGAGFGALITALASRVAALETAGGGSVIRSIQRGVMNAASATITQVDASKSMLNITSVHSAYASQYAHASRYAYSETRRLASGIPDTPSGDHNTVIDDEVLTISPLAVVTRNTRLTLDSSGTQITRAGTSLAVGYEVIEFM